MIHPAEEVCTCGHEWQLHAPACSGTGAMLDAIYEVPPDEACACKGAPLVDYLVSMAFGLTPDGNDDEHGAIGCPVCATTWATSDSVGLHLALVHGTTYDDATRYTPHA